MDDKLNRDVFSTVRIDEEQQKRAGIEIIHLQQAQYQSEFLAFGQVQNLQPLLTWRNAFLKARIACHSAQAELEQAEQNLHRIKRLHQNKAASTRKLQTAQTRWQKAKDNCQSQCYQRLALKQSAILSWGKTLAEALMQTETEQLFDRQHSLLKITLPANRSLPAQTRTIWISPSGLRQQAKPAFLISPAPAADPVSQGETWYFRSTPLRTGLSVTAWIPESKTTVIGVWVPEAAVVRHLGQAFVYLKKSADSFIRKSISAQFAGRRGYFVATGLQAGDALVRTGAQLLLSEEFRGQIPEEDDD